VYPVAENIQEGVRSGTNVQFYSNRNKLLICTYRGGVVNSPERIGLHGNDITQLKRQCPIDLSCTSSSEGSVKTTQQVADARLGSGNSHLEILPFGELHVGLLQQGPEVSAVPLEPLQASEGARRVGEFAIVLLRPERQIPCVENKTHNV
jgi:hypothetical protein